MQDHLVTNKILVESCDSARIKLLGYEDWTESQSLTEAVYISRKGAGQPPEQILPGPDLSEGRGDQLVSAPLLLYSFTSSLKKRARFG